MLASDLNNPDFIGATDPDSKLHVEFFINERKDKIGPDGNKLTDYEGKPFVRIMVPGDQTSIYEQPAKEHHMRRFPRHWLAFQAAQQGDARLIGTPLEAWNLAKPDDLGGDQMRELQALGFRTVEQVAMASDHQMQRVGMGGVGVRARAQGWLDSRNRGEAHAELAETKRQLAEMQAMIAQLVQNGSIQADPPRRGRPPKIRDVNDVHDDDVAARPAGDERVGSAGA